MFPRQGEWTESDYLRREFDGLVEYVDGTLEFLPMPTFSHQDLVAFLYEQLNSFIGPKRPREVYFAPVRVRMKSGNCREPDVAYIQSHRISTSDRTQPSNGADLVMEVVSPDPRDRDRDYHEKRSEYAASGIREYWVVDPENQTITVLVLSGAEYHLHGEFKLGTSATSQLLPGFEIDVKTCFDSIDPPA
ncbi:MAG: Uma2 family endonuclease [Planctomycetota bacterium]|nr:MAG: Uma2 family endonuclease [Planctomycetota bacterium]